MNEPSPHKTLVLLSGGADSFYCILKQLRETDDVIHVHSHWLENNRPLSDDAHVKNKLKAEKEHRDKYVIPWLQRNEREFTTSFSYHDFSDMPQDAFFVNRTRFTLYIAAMYGQAYGVGRILSGHDFSMGFPKYNNGDCEKIISAGWLGRPPEDLEWITPRAHLPKEKVYEYLGDLADLTFSCNAPRLQQDGVWQWCEECCQCLDIIRARGSLPDIRREMRHAA